MIRVTDLRGETRIINADLIEFIETAPETQIAMNDGKRVFVRETPEEIVSLVVAYKQLCHYAPPEMRSRQS